MRFYPENRDNGPIRYIGRVPVYAATIIAVLYCAGMFATVMVSAAGGAMYNFEFSTEDFFRHGWLWQIFTCTFVNGPTFFFLFGVFFFYQFGSEIEQFFGRRSFLLFYALQVATIALVLGAWRLTGPPGIYAGMNEVTIGMFIGYATLYPNLECFGWVQMKVVAFACLVISLLSYLQAGDRQGLTVMLAICAVSFGFIRHAKLGGTTELGEWVAKLNLFRRRPKFRVLPPPDRPSPRNVGGGSGASVDAILDKIASTGFASLTQDERDQLERAREFLNRKRH